MWYRNPDQRCPVQTLPNGGLPTGGHFGSYTQYEVGARLIGEAAHCLLGSWNVHDQDFEPNHVIEEFLIIETTVINYGADIIWLIASEGPWREKLWGIRYDENNYRIDSIISMKRAAKRLEKKAYELRQFVDLPNALQQSLAEQTYLVVQVFCGALIESLNADPILNVYQNSDLHLAIKELRITIEKWLRVFHPNFNQKLMELSNVEYPKIWDNKIYKFYQQKLRKNPACEICWKDSCNCDPVYKSWLARVDDLLKAAIGMTSKELPSDYLWADAYIGGFSPIAAINLMVGPLDDPNRLLENIYIEGSGLGDFQRYHKLSNEDIGRLAEDILRDDLGE